MNIKKLQKLVDEYGPNYPIEVLKALGGYYNCPKDNETGKRLGPLVGYAGTYTGANSVQFAYVGDLYANFAKAEEWPLVMAKFGADLGKKLQTELLNDIAYSPENLVIAGPEKGGFAIAEHLALYLGCRKAYIEKDIIAVKTLIAREQSKLAFKRHSVGEGDIVVITEDVSNNFSTTGKAIDLVQEAGAKVLCIATILNRSPHIDGVFTYKENIHPVISLVRMKAAEYKQDDPEVMGDITSGNIVWKPKDAWDTLPEEGKNN